MINSAEALDEIANREEADQLYREARGLLIGIIEENPDSLIIEKAQVTLKNVNERMKVE
ncbi:MAG: hypothetical protein AAGD22_18315 [Verrucomicrobiota bacterium]